MQIQTNNTFSNFKTNYCKTNATSVPQQLHNTEEKTIKTAKDKDKIIIGGIAALAILGIGAAIAIKRHKAADDITKILTKQNTENVTETAAKKLQTVTEDTGKLLESIKACSDEASEKVSSAVDTMQKKYNEVMELFKKGDEISPDGTVLRSITCDDTKKVMEEYTQEGKILRRSTFMNNNWAVIEEGIESCDGGYKTALTMEFRDGKPSYFGKNIEYQGQKWKKEFTIGFNDGNPTYLDQGYEELKDHSWTRLSRVEFKQGTPVKYIKGGGQLSNGTLTSGREFEFTNDAWQEIV